MFLLHLQNDNSEKFIVEDSHGVELTKTRDFVVVMREARQPRLLLWMVQIIILGKSNAEWL